MIYLISSTDCAPQFGALNVAGRAASAASRTGSRVTIEAVENAAKAASRSASKAVVRTRPPIVVVARPTTKIAAKGSTGTKMTAGVAKKTTRPQQASNANIYGQLFSVLGKKTNTAKRQYLSSPLQRSLLVKLLKRQSLLQLQLVLRIAASLLKQAR